MTDAVPVDDPRRSRAWTAEAQAFLPLALPVVGVWLAWAALEGGFWPSLWGPLGIVLVGTLAIGIAAFPPDPHTWGAARLAVFVLIALFVCWSFLSGAWADFPANAWEGSNKTLLYAVCFGLFAAWQQRPGALVAVLALFSLGVTAIGVAALGGALRDADGAFADGRLVEPIGYVNANAALWTTAFWPACFLAASPRLPLPLRAASLASAGLLLQVALLGQSRAWLLLLPVVAALALALARQRLQLLLAFALAGSATAVVAPLLLDVREAAVAGRLGPAVGRAAVAVALSSLLLALAGAIWAAADRRFTIPARAARTLGVAVAVLGAVAVIGVAAAGARAVDDPGAWLSDRWQDFARGSYPEGDRFSGSLASNRYDHWRIAWAEFRESPVTGAGVENYYAAYLLRRETSEAEPRYPHSWALALLSQVGIVGTGLFLAAASLAVGLALRARRRLDAADAAGVAAALTVFGYWLIHGAVDWFWEIPALAAPAFGLLGLASAVSATAKGPRRTGVGRGRRAAALTGVVALAAAVSLALPWLSYLHQRAGVAVWRSNPQLAYERLDRAASLNPIAGEPLLLKGSIALRRRDLETAEVALEHVLDREPRSWYAWFQLALVAAVDDDYAEAGERIARARELNPRDPIVAEAAELIARREPVDPERLNRRFRDLAAKRIANTGE